MTSFVDEDGMSAMYETREETGGGRSRADGTAAATTNATTDATGFDELELRLALEASVKETSGDLLAVELEFGDARGTTSGTRTRGRELANKFWIQQALEAEDVLDESADGWYDVRGEAFETSEDGRLPDLRHLLDAPVLGDEEALVVDRKTDVFLAALDDLAAQTCAVAPNARAKCAALARLVVDRLGGSVRSVDDRELERAVAMDREDLLANGRGCVVHVGHLNKGLERHRAVLFKALAATVGLPCRLVRGEYYCGRDTARVIFTDEDGTGMWVDLMIVPGALRNSPAYSNEIPRTPPRYANGHQQHWEFSHASFRTDKGKSPLQAPSDDTKSSIDDLVAFASYSSERGLSSAATTSKHQSSELEDDDDDLAMVYSAIAVAHGVTLKSVACAFKLAEHDSERANFLCNALGEVLAEEAARPERSGEYSEPVLLQEMFNLLVAKKWIVSDAVSAFAKRRREEIAASEAARAETARIENEKRAEAARLRREEQKLKAAEEVKRTADERVEKFREDRVKSSEDSERAEALRNEFRQEWTAKVASMNLAETLECFGVTVEGGVHANAKQLRSAYRKALLTFHPDRQSGKELAQRVAAEETFKILSHKMEHG